MDDYNISFSPLSVSILMDQKVLKCGFCDNCVFNKYLCVIQNVFIIGITYKNVSIKIILPHVFNQQIDKCLFVENIL